MAKREHGFGFGSLFSLSTESATNTNENDEVVVNIHLDLGSFVFVVTSDLGANKIFGGMRARVENNKELYDKIQNDVMVDVKNHFGPHASFARSLVSYIKRKTP